MFTDHVQKQTHDHSSGNESEVSLSTLNTFFFFFQEGVLQESAMADYM